MPGSLDNPVVLDPWQAIVEVGWGLRFLAIRTQVTWTSDFDRQDCPVSAGDPPAGHAHLYVTESSFKYSGESVIQTMVLKSGGWESPEETVAVQGMPVLPGPTTYGAFEWRAAGTAQPRARWQIPAAAMLDTVIPTIGEPFYDTTTATVEMVAPQYTGPPVGCFVTDASFGINSLYAPHTGDRVSFSPHAMDFGGVTATYKGRQYQAIGIYVSNTGGALVEPSTTWILCGPIPTG